MLLLIVVLPIYLGFTAWAFVKNETELAAALLGVVAGWLSSVAWDRYKESARAKQLRKAIINEMNANQRLLSVKCSHLSQAILELKRGRLLRSTILPFYLDLYEKHLGDISGDLGAEEYVSLAHICSSLRLYDQQLAALNQMFADAQLKPGSIQRLLGSELQQMESMLSHFVRLAGQMDAHIGGKPIDVAGLCVPAGDLDRAFGLLANPSEAAPSGVPPIAPTSSSPRA